MEQAAWRRSLMVRAVFFGLTRRRNGATVWKSLETTSGSSGGGTTRKNRRGTCMNENHIANRVMDAAFQIHRELGPGLLESVYEVVLARKLSDMSLEVARQVPVPIQYEGITFEEGFRADLVVEKRVIIELKSVERLQPVHSKQLLTYLRLTDCRLGLLINFGEILLKDGFKRVVNGLEDVQRGAGKTRRLGPYY
jgi:GxxExxY protein